MPSCSGRVCAVVWRRKIVVTDGMRRAESFDPATGRWEQLPMLKCRRRKYAMAIHRDRLMVMGGYDEHGFCLDSVEIYDEEIGEWEYGSPLNFARDALVASF